MHTCRPIWCRRTIYTCKVTIAQGLPPVFTSSIVNWKIVLGQLHILLFYYWCGVSISACICLYKFKCVLASTSTLSIHASCLCFTLVRSEMKSTVIKLASSKAKSRGNPIMEQGQEPYLGRSPNHLRSTWDQRFYNQLIQVMLGQSFNSLQVWI